MTLEKPRVAVVDDDAEVLQLLEETLHNHFDVTIFTSASTCLEELARSPVELLVSDVVMPEMNGLDVMKRVRALSPTTEVILLTGHATLAQAVEAVKCGVHDYLAKPFLPGELVLRCQRALGHRRLVTRNQLLEEEVRSKAPSPIPVGDSPPMRAVFRLMDQVKALATTVLILGESGTGKELVARAIHSLSPRAGRSFVPINCGAIPRDLMESELLGHMAGAFSGAAGPKPGLIEEAEGGTLFLDEVSELPLDLQVKLNRVIQEREVRRLGELRSRRVDVRFLAASNKDLDRLAQEGRFREDLLFRLNVYPIQLPPLRDRREDIPKLAEHFLRRFAGWGGKRILSLSPEAASALMTYPWPGNVRELENSIERAVILETSGLITPDSLPAHILSPGRVPPAAGPPPGEAPGSYRAAVELATNGATLSYLNALMRYCQGNVTRAATIAEVDRTTLHRLLKKHNLDPDEFR